jgi:Fe-Mn family superoxide dismutase
LANCAPGKPIWQPSDPWFPFAFTGGGAWNHALYFKHLAPASSPNADPAKSISKDLSAAISSSFGTLAKMQEQVTTAATKVFGSGWAWVCYTGES